MRKQPFWPCLALRGSERTEGHSEEENHLAKKGESNWAKEPPASPLLSTHSSALCPEPCVISSKDGRGSQDPQLAKHLVILL